jgi:DnaK suppressor protein
MAKTQPKKKAAPPAKRAAGKSAAKKAPAKAAKPAAGKATKKTASAAAKKPVARKPAPKPAPKAAKSKAAPAKSAKASKPTAAAAPNKRAVAVSHRPQSGAVAVQARPNKATPSARTRSGGFDGSLPSGTTLTEDQVRRAPDSAYMNDNQLAFFQERLLQMRSEVLARELDVKERLHQREVFADPADRASAEEEHWLDLRLRERESLLLKKIDDALRRIRDKEYGYCEKTGEAIGIARLLARPTATVCVDIKGQDERAESQYRDR